MNANIQHPKIILFAIAKAISSPVNALTITFIPRKTGIISRVMLICGSNGCSLSLFMIPYTRYPAMATKAIHVIIFIIIGS
jgi:hypothetical protein